MAISPVKLSSEAELSYFAGVWGDIQCIVPHTDANDTSEGQTMNGTACYDIILMAETVYSMSALPGLYKLIEKVPNYSYIECFLEGLFLFLSSQPYFTVHKLSSWSGLCSY
ncbi:unnamed protein product [Cuscuta epithymum]|uniref:Uncharacterized protein n=1 Tax=Cuscuta epithymum TaxID=186058 RepID=A0AAV0CZ15_9ASTE|nr:unnamed protein product [Cuscuta epithymum]